MGRLFHLHLQHPGCDNPPIAWLMPLIGDAVIGVTGIAMVAILLRACGLWAWTALVVWNSLAIWDALSAFILHLTNPWPEFFMIKTFGASMFFIASAMHAANLYILACRNTRDDMGLKS